MQRMSLADLAYADIMILLVIYSAAVIDARSHRSSKLLSTMLTGDSTDISTNSSTAIADVGIATTSPSLNTSILSGKDTLVDTPIRVQLPAGKVNIGRQSRKRKLSSSKDQDKDNNLNKVGVTTHNRRSDTLLRSASAGTCHCSMSDGSIMQISMIPSLESTKAHATRSQNQRDKDENNEKHEHRQLSNGHNDKDEETDPVTGQDNIKDMHDSGSSHESAESKAASSKLRRLDIPNKAMTIKDKRICVDCHDHAWDPDYSNMFLLPEKWDEGTLEKNVCAYWMPDPEGYPINQILAEKGIPYTMHGVFNMERGDIKTCLSKEKFIENFLSEEFATEYLSSCHKDNYTCCTSQYREYKKHACATQNSYETWIDHIDNCIDLFSNGQLFPRVCHYDHNLDCNQVDQMWSQKPARTVGCRQDKPICKQEALEANVSKKWKISPADEE